MPMSRDEMIALYDRMRNPAQQTGQRAALASDFNWDLGASLQGKSSGGQDDAARERNSALQQRYSGESDAGYNARMEQRFGGSARGQGLSGYQQGSDLVSRFLDGQSGWRTQAREGVLAEDAKNKELDDQIKAFYGRMNSQLDPNDPEVRAAMAMGTNTGQRVSRDRGLRGGLSTSGIVQASQNALNPIRQFRQQQALQALNLLSGRNLGQRQLAMGEAGQAREAENERWAKQQSLMQMILAGVGTVGSAVAAPFTGGATLPGVAAGAAAFGDGVNKFANAGKQQIANNKAAGGNGTGG